MAVPLAVLQALLAVEPVARHLRVAGSLVLRRMARSCCTTWIASVPFEIGTGAPLRRGFF